MGVLDAEYTSPSSSGVSALSRVAPAPTSGATLASSSPTYTAPPPASSPTTTGVAAIGDATNSGSTPPAPTTPTSSPTTLSPQQRDVLARVAYAEDRSGGENGMAAVVETIRNRANDPLGRWPTDPVSVALQSGQFAKPATSIYEPDALKQAYLAVDKAMSGQTNLTNGATYFETPNSAKSKRGLAATIPGLAPVANVGGHIFYVDKAPPPAKPNEPTRVVQYGDMGPEVAKWQTDLQKLGFYNGNIDGDFGTMTRAATRRYQRQFGLTVDGKIGVGEGAETGPHLANAANPPIPRERPVPGAVQPVPLGTPPSTFSASDAARFYGEDQAWQREHAAAVADLERMKAENEARIAHVNAVTAIVHGGRPYIAPPDNPSGVPGQDLSGVSALASLAPPAFSASDAARASGAHAALTAAIEANRAKAAAAAADAAGIGTVANGGRPFIAPADNPSGVPGQTLPVAAAAPPAPPVNVMQPAAPAPAAVAGGPIAVPTQTIHVTPTTDEWGRPIDENGNLIETPVPASLPPQTEVAPPAAAPAEVLPPGGMRVLDTTDTLASQKANLDFNEANPPTGPALIMQAPDAALAAAQQFHLDAMKERHKPTPAEEARAKAVLKQTLPPAGKPISWRRSSALIGNAVLAAETTPEEAAAVKAFGFDRPTTPGKDQSRLGAPATPGGPATSVDDAVKAFGFDRTPGAAPEKAAPAPEEAAAQSWWQSVKDAVAGAGRGVMDAGDTVTEAAVNAASAITDKLAQTGVVSPETAADVAKYAQEKIAGDRQRLTAFEQAYGNKPPLFELGIGNLKIAPTAVGIGRLGGQTAATIPAGGLAGKGLTALARIGGEMSPVVTSVARFLGGTGGKGFMTRLMSGMTAGAAAGAGAAALTSGAAPDKSIVDQMATGALAGGVAGGAVHLMSGAVTALRSMWSTATPAATAGAVSTMATRMEELGISPEALSQKIRASKSSTIADLDPRLATDAEGLARTGGESTAHLAQTFSDRAAEARQRIGSEIDTMLGPAPDIETHLRNIQKTASAEYEKAEGAAIAKWQADPTPIRVQPVIREARAVKTLSDQQRALVDTFDGILTHKGFTAANDGGKVYKSSLGELIGAKHTMDEYIKTNLKPGTGSYALGVRMVKALDSRIKAASPDYAAAAKAYAGDQRTREAVQLGQRIFDKNLSAEDLAREISGMSDDEISGLLLGARHAINKEVTTAAGGELAGAAKLYDGSSANFDKMKLIYGDGTQGILDRVKQAINEAATATKVNRGVSQVSGTLRSAARDKIMHHGGNLMTVMMGALTGHAVGGSFVPTVAGAVGAAAMRKGAEMVGSALDRRSQTALAHAYALAGADAEKFLAAVAAYMRGSKSGVGAAIGRSAGTAGALTTRRPESGRSPGPDGIWYTPDDQIFYGAIRR